MNTTPPAPESGASTSHFFSDPAVPGRYRPTEHTRGPWDPASLHGRDVSALLMYEVERLHADPAFQVARHTVDMFRVAPRQPVDVSTQVVRDGNRIRVIDASIAVDGVEVGRASIVMLRHAPHPEGRVWAPEPWHPPHPDTVAPDRHMAGGSVPWAWETRSIQGSFGTFNQRLMWIRDSIGFVDDVLPSPLVRAALVSDFANPFANSGEAGLQFVNGDATLYMHRDPVGEWIGLQGVAHHAGGGVAIGEIALYDLDGLWGRTTVCSVAQSRAHQG